MLEILASIFGGGMTGLFGSIVSGILGIFRTKYEIKKLESEHQFEIDKMRVESEIMDKEYAHKKDLAVIEAESEMEKSADTLMKASYKHDGATYSGEFTENAVNKWPWLSIPFILVDFFRGLIRPLMTAYLSIVVTYMYVMANGILNSNGMSFSPEKFFEVYNLITMTILYLATTCVSWWFGDRMITKKLNFNIK